MYVDKKKIVKAAHALSNFLCRAGSTGACKHMCVKVKSSEMQ